MIILGSQSPRRRELMAGLDIDFTAVTIDCDESFPAELGGGDIPLYIAKQKAAAFHNRLQTDDLLVTADTIVWLNGEMLGKPHDTEDAKRMLKKLSGKTHQVYTAVCLTKHDWQHEFVAKTDVTFACLTESEIDYYIEKYKPLDKAGAYGVQEWIGYVAVTRLEGSYFNVMGLPTEQLAEELRKLGIGR